MKFGIMKFKNRRKPNSKKKRVSIAQQDKYLIFSYRSGTILWKMLRSASAMKPLYQPGILTVVQVIKILNVLDAPHHTA